MIFLACCHSIIIDKKQGKYNASSPDELALVNFAKQSGYVFSSKIGDVITIENKTNKDDIKEITFTLLSICEFTSDRKRQSCIYRTNDGKIKLMCKGADSVIESILST